MNLSVKMSEDYANIISISASADCAFSISASTVSTTVSTVSYSSGTVSSSASTVSSSVPPVLVPVLSVFCVSTVNTIIIWYCSFENRLGRGLYINSICFMSYPF